MELLQVDNVRVGYGSIEVLKGITLSTISAGMVTLIGANGAGKTTMLRAITGLQKPLSGSISFQGHRIDHLPGPKIVSLGISMVPENRRIFSTLSVMDNLKAGAVTCWNREKIYSDIKRVFNIFPILNDRKNQLGGTLSGGEQQMLAIGRALMSHPKLLLLDEPSMGLAPILVRVVFDMIHNISQQGTSVLLIEQNAKIALKISEFGYVLETGRIALSGPSKDLIQNENVVKFYLGGD